MDFSLTWVIAAAVAVLIVCAVVNYWVINREPDHKPAPPAKAPEPTLDAQMLIHDLTRHGSALVRIEVVNIGDVLLRSPRTPQ